MNGCVNTTPDEPNIDMWRLADDSHSWLHRCFPPQPSICLFCRAVQGTLEGEQPCPLVTPL